MARLTVHVHPKASRNDLRVEADGAISVWTTAPPVDDKANVAVCRLLAARLKQLASTVRITTGQRRRLKLLQVDGLTVQEVHRLLTAQSAQGEGNDGASSP